MDQNQYQPYQNYFDTLPVKKNAAYYRARAREALKPCYWMAFLASLLASALGALSGSSFQFNFNFDTEVDSTVYPQLQEQLRAFLEIARTEGISGIFTEYPYVPIFLVILGVSAVFGILLTLFVSAPITLGYQRYTLNVIDGQGKDIAVLFSYFKRCYGKAICLRLVYDLIMFLIGLPLTAVTLGMLWFSRGAIYSIMMGETTPQTIASVALMLMVISFVAIVTSVVQIWMQYRYSFCFMILAEYPEMRVIDALHNSASLMRGNKFRLFCLQLSFLGWMVLAIMCTCGLGALFLTPYMSVANAAFYDDIANRAAARETEFPSLNPDDYKTEE